MAGEPPPQTPRRLPGKGGRRGKEAMGKEVAPATDVVQEDMFAAAGRQADETPQPVELTPEQRDAAEARLLQEAIAGGEVRPPNAPIPELPAPAQVRLDELDPNEPITPGSKAAQALADETRLALEHARADAALQEVQERALKDANDYELLTFDQKKDAGLTTGLDKAITPEVLPPEADLLAGASRKITERTSEGRIQTAAESLMAWTTKIGGKPMSIDEALRLVKAKGAILDPDQVPGLDMEAARSDKTRNYIDTPATEAVRAAYEQFYGVQRAATAAPQSATPLADAIEGQMRQMAQSDARLYRRTGEAMANIRQGLDELAPAPVRPEPIRLVQPASQPELLLPQDLRKASPRYGRNTIIFQSDLDRAAYVLANDAVKPSKSAAKFRQVVQEAGLDLKDVVAHGQKVKAALKQAAKGNPGQIELPAQRWGDDVKPQPQAAADRLQRQIGDIDQQITDNRRKAEQEGC